MSEKYIIIDGEDGLISVRGEGVLSKENITICISGLHTYEEVEFTPEQAKKLIEAIQFKLNQKS